MFLISRASIWFYFGERISVRKRSVQHSCSHYSCGQCHHHLESLSVVEVESNGKEFNYHLSSDLYGTTKYKKWRRLLQGRSTGCQLTVSSFFLNVVINGLMEMRVNPILLSSFQRWCYVFLSVQIQPCVCLVQLYYTAVSGRKKVDPTCSECSIVGQSQNWIKLGMVIFKDQMLSVYAWKPCSKIKMLTSNINRFQEV